jgi:hypothetical protein
MYHSVSSTISQSTEWGNRITSVAALPPKESMSCFFTLNAFLFMIFTISMNYYLDIMIFAEYIAKKYGE